MYERLLFKGFGTNEVYNQFKLSNRRTEENDENKTTQIKLKTRNTDITTLKSIFKIRFKVVS